MKYLNKAMLKQICLAVLVLVLITAPSANAQKNIFQTRLNIMGEYSDNIQFERENPREDFYTDIEPTVAYMLETERLSLNSRASVSVIRYSEEAQNDREDQDYLLNCRYNFSERFNFVGNASYRRDTTLETELIETGEVTTEQNRDRYVGGGKISWRFSELSGLGLNYNYLKKEFGKEYSIDYERHSISLDFSRYINNGLDSISVIPAYEYRTSEMSELENYTLSLGWRHEYSETFSVSVSAGGRYTEQTYNDDITSDDSGFIADVSFKRITEAATAEFGYGRSLFTNTGGSETEVDQVYLNLNRRVFRRLRIGVTGRFYLRTRPNSSSDEERTYFQVRPTLNYRLTEFQNLEIGYMYSKLDERFREEDPTIDRHSAWIVLKLRYDKIW